MTAIIEFSSPNQSLHLTRLSQFVCGWWKTEVGIAFTVGQVRSAVRMFLYYVFETDHQLEWNLKPLGSRFECWLNLSCEVGGGDCDLQDELIMARFAISPPTQATKCWETSRYRQGVNDE